MNFDTSRLANAFAGPMPRRGGIGGQPQGPFGGPANRPLPMGGGIMGGRPMQQPMPGNSGIVPPHMQQPRPMNQPMRRGF